MKRIFDKFIEIENYYINEENIKFLEKEEIEINITEEDLNKVFNIPYQAQSYILFLFQYKLMKIKDKEKKAYLSYLISYLLFIVITPMLSEELAKEYAEISIENSSDLKYKKWKDFVQEGN